MRPNQVSDRPSFTLQTGREVEVTGVGLEQRPNGSWTMHVDYVSALPVRDYVAVAPEVVQVWAEFRGLAESRGASTVMVRVTGQAEDPRSVAFGFIQEPDGRWEKPEVRTLRTGKKVLVVRVSQDGAHLFIDYVTGHGLRDTCALGPEVDEVWTIFQGLAEQSGVDSVFVSPSSAPVGGGSISFSVTRDRDGGWSRQELCRPPAGGP